MRLRAEHRTSVALFEPAAQDEAQACRTRTC
jgi:hypothetical protein